MRVRVITGEKSKSCVVFAIGMILYLLESAFEESGASIMRGLCLFFSVHAVVLLAKCVYVSRKAAADENAAKLLKFVVVATLMTGFAAVCCIYASGKAFDTEWRAYVNSLVIGGLSAIFHLIPLERFKHKPEASSVPHKR